MICIKTRFKSITRFKFKKVYVLLSLKKKKVLNFVNIGALLHCFPSVIKEYSVDFNKLILYHHQLEVYLPC